MTMPMRARGFLHLMPLRHQTRGLPRAHEVELFHLSRLIQRPFFQQFCLTISITLRLMNSYGSLKLSLPASITACLSGLFTYYPMLRRENTKNGMYP